MKKLFLLFAVLMVAVVGLSALSWAQEASVYDGTINRVIRTCESCTSCASTDPNGNCTSCTTYGIFLEVRNPAVGGGVDNAYNVACPGAAPNPGYATVLSSATDYDLSLALDPSHGTAYVFYTDGSIPNPPTNMIQCSISSSSPTTYTLSGTVTNGSSGLQGVTMTLSGGGTGTTSTDGNGNYSFSNLAAGSYTVTPTLSNYTFAPGSWTGSVSANTTVPNFVGSAATTACADLVVVSFGGPTGIFNNSPFNVSIKIANNGSCAAGPFDVKVYFSGTQTIDSSARVLGTWNVSGLGAGETQSNTLSVQVTGAPGHIYMWLIGMVDADNQVAETNENNNTRAYRAFIQ